jgi:hypothetical protein
MSPAKLLVLYGMLVIALPFAYAVYQGRAYRATQDCLELDHHRDATNFALWYTLAGIALIEMGVRQQPHAHAPMLLWVHLPLAAAFLALLLILRFWLTGLRSRKYHGPLGRLCAALFLCTLATGGILMLQM